ncbi:MAG: LysE family translocator [Rhodospirillaceae bacterium]|nr:LysE family translocator [Rhodospirillaceae bacterium]
MSFGNAITLSLVMAFWALLPGPGLAVVLARTLTSGTKAGGAVIAGLILADLIFLAIAFLGLIAIASALGPFFEAIKYAGGAYLIWRGIQTFRQASKPPETLQTSVRDTKRDVGLGLLVTLGNPKAILFFGAILPTFVDMTAIAIGNFIAVSAIVIGVSSLVYGSYMVLAISTRQFIGPQCLTKRLNQAVGTMLIGSGITIVAR